MAYDYGYGELGNQLVELFSSGPPDFDAAQKLIQQGADLNAAGNDQDENILSEVLYGYRDNIAQDNACDDQDNYEHFWDSESDAGLFMCQIIRFFLNHGFDVNKFDGCYGAQCLYALTLSTFDRSVIDAAKILLDAGAKNRSTSPDPAYDDQTPWSFMSIETSYQSTCEHNFHLSNIYEAVCQIYYAAEKGINYSGIDSYEIAIGRKVLKILAGNRGTQSTFRRLSLPEFHSDNCFTENLYFVYNGGALVTTRYGEFWTNTELPDDLIDISDRFRSIIGSAIQEITYDCNTIVKGTHFYGQPITTIEMSSGQQLIFSTNFGQADDENYAAYYEMISEG